MKKSKIVGKKMDDAYENTNSGVQEKGTEVKEQTTTDKRLSSAYRTAVLRIFQDQSKQIIDNGEPEHAAVLFEQFFKHAKYTVRIFCKNLSKNVFDRDEVLHAAKSAINRGVLVKICSQDPLEGGSKFVEALKGGFDYYKCTEEFMDKPNFATMDRRGFRFEANPEECVASASANNPKLAAQLVRIFDEQVCHAV